MTLIRPSLDYTAKDFDALRDRLFNIIPSAFPDWTDLEIANFGNLLVDMFAYVGDVMSFYQDNQARESRWSTALLRRSLLSLAKLIAFEPTNAAAATATLTVQLSAPPAGSVTIEAGDTFTTANVSVPITFQVLANTVIAAGADPAAVFITVENSQQLTELYVSNGLPNQTYALSSLGFLDAIISADDGVYIPVADFLSSTATSRHVVVSVDENARASISFGNGIAGNIPSGTIRFEYKTGGGVAGNVPQNSITRANRAYQDSLGNPVIMRVTNAARASGGANGQTVEAIREAAPRSLRTLTRTVSREDYENNALRVPGVARALMLTRDEMTGVRENTGLLYIVPQGGGTASSAVIAAVNQMVTVNYPKTITFKLTTLSALYLPVNISTKIHLTAAAKATDATRTAVVGAIRQALAQFFSTLAPDGSQNTAINFGYYMGGALAWSDVFNVIRDIRGVKKIDDGLGRLVLNGESDDVAIAPQFFPRLGAVQIIDAVTGTAL